MDSEQSRYQLVFLVDENSKDRTNYRVDRYVNTVRSTVLKLLTHFSNVVREDVKQLQWSYKFYESHSSKGRPIQKYVFKEFNHGTFEEFENDLELRIQQPRPGDIGWTCYQSAVQQSQDPMEGDPLENLTTALREITFEYPWDRPDILSPVKPVRRAKAKHKRPSFSQGHDDTGKHNLLFLFTPCPKSTSDLKRFADCDDSGGLLKSILPKHLYLHFCHQNKIRMFWMLDETQPFNITDFKVRLLANIDVILKCDTCNIPVCHYYVVRCKSDICLEYSWIVNYRVTTHCIFNTNRKYMLLVSSI